MVLTFKYQYYFIEKIKKYRIFFMLFSKAQHYYIGSGAVSTDKKRVRI